MTSVFHIYDDFLKTKYNEHEVVHMLRDAGNFSNFWIWFKILGLDYGDGTLLNHLFFNLELAITLESGK